MNDEDLLPAVERLKDQPVLVVGDLMLDRFVHGRVERISPEAPIPVMHVEREETMLGGAGNVVRNLKALGAQPAFVSVIGDDAAGQELQAQVANSCGEHGHLLLDRSRINTIKERHVSAGQQLLRVDRGTTAALSDTMAEALIDATRDALNKAAVLVISDYGKGVLTGRVLQAIIATASERNRPVVVDPKGRDFGRYRGARVVTPNKRELAEASGLPVGDDLAIVAAARKAAVDAGLAAVLATRSEEGMTLLDGERVTHLAAEAREVFDVSGAGDTVVAALAAGLAAGLDLVTAARLANVAAGIVVGKLGTAVVEPGEIAQLLHSRSLMEADHKVATLDGALAMTERWRRAGLTVGFTNGCFDLLHPGHVSMLRQAKATADRLVVGLNSDASVKRLKGESRPVQNEVARATVLASLSAVDAVVIFGEDTPLKVIETLRPDSLVKGADYTVDRVVGADLVRSYGGKVHLARLEEGHSTTNTIARLTAGAS